MGERLKGKVAVVTGGASGIGAAAIRLFASEGAAVLIADIAEDKGFALADELGQQFIKTDVTEEKQVAAAVKLASEKYNRLDCMVNNAGVIGATGPILDTSSEHWCATLAVLLNSVFYGIKHAGKVMAEQKSGSILSIASVSGVTTGLGPHAYTTAKHGVVGLTKSASTELAAYGVRVNAVAPGATVTPMVAEARDGSIEAAMIGSAETNPLERPILPGDIAAALLFLASDDSINISGQTIVVDGGRTVGGFINPTNAPPPNYHSLPIGFRGPTTRRDGRMAGLTAQG